MANPLKAGPNVSPVLAVAVICLALGAAAGYAARFWVERPSAGNSPGTPPGGMMGGGPGGMGGFGGGQQPNASRDLTSLIRRLSVIEKISGKELNAAQAAKVIEVAEKLRSAKTVSDDECKKQLDALNAMLTSDQKDALDALQPQGGMGKMGKMGKMGGIMGGPPPGAARPDNPFAEGQGKERVDELVAQLRKKAK